MPTDSILVVDDEDGVRDLLMNFLKLKGYRMSEATSGEEALTLLDQNPDLLITDFKMSGMDGLALAKNSLAIQPDRPVILMTAFADVDNARESVTIGIYDFILKPFDLVDFENAVSRALKHRHLVLENKEYQRNLEQMVKKRTMELQEALDRLDRKVKELEARDRVNQLLLTVHTPDETFSSIIEAVQIALDAERVVLFLPDASRKELEPVCGVGVRERGDMANPNVLMGLTDSWIEEASASAARAFQEGRVVSEGENERLTRAAVPMLRLGEGVGVVFVQNPFSGKSFGDEDLHELTGLTAQAAVAISDASMYGDSDSWKAIIEDLGDLTSKQG